jgi:hypothetical protein
MLNLNVYDEKIETPVINLRLIKRDSGSVALCCVNANGMELDQGILLTINTNGTIMRHGGVSDKLGFKFTDKYRASVMIEN